MNYQKQDELAKHRKIIYLDPELLAGYLGNWALSGLVMLPQIQGAEGAKIIDVFFDSLRQSIGVVVAREDWGEVAQGVVPPELTRNLVYNRVKVVGYE